MLLKLIYGGRNKNVFKKRKLILLAASGYGTIHRHQRGGGIHVPGSQWRNALFETGRSADSNIRRTINKKT